MILTPKVFKLKIIVFYEKAFPKYFSKDNFGSNQNFASTFWIPLDSSILFGIDLDSDGILDNNYVSVSIYILQSQSSDSPHMTRKNGNQ